MKVIYLSILVLGLPASAQAFECKPIANYGEAARWECQHESKEWSVLQLKGSYTQTLEQHAHLLGEEIIQGPLSEVIESLRTNLNAGSLISTEFKDKIFDCYYNRIRESVSSEFYQAGLSFTNALQKRLGKKNPYSSQELQQAIYAIELSIAFDGLTKKLESDPVGTLAELANTCSLRITQNVVDDLVTALNPLSKMKLGCIGFVSPESHSESGDLMHARNLDANLVSTWNQEPVLFLVEEPGFLKYAAVASAGVIYPGGISGMNEAGISVSLHELSTTEYATKHSRRSAELAPFLQQRILREASSIDEAVRIIQRTNHFGAWTILISDAKTNEIASVEISGKRTQVARRRTNESMGQSNHFLGSRMRDQHFFYSFGKILESNSRIQVVESALDRDAGQIDFSWMIDHLAGHQDSIEGFRAFGRTAVKAYNVMSTVTIPARQELWMSIGNRMPAAHSHFAGFSIDFERMNFWPLGVKRTQVYDAIPSWENSLETYVYARLSYEAGHIQSAYDLTNRALLESKEDGIDETTYRYILGRLALELNNPHLALFHFRILEGQRDQLAAHKRALVALYSAAAIQQMPNSDRKSRSADLRRYVQTAESIFTQLNRSRPHFDLKAKLELLKRIKSRRDYSLPKIDFVTVE